MKKFVKAIIHRLPTIFVNALICLPFCIIVLESDLTAIILVNTVGNFVILILLAIGDIRVDNRAKKIRNIEKVFRFLIKDFDYKIEYKQSYGDIDICGQISYVNEKFRITIMADENVRIIISDIKSSVVYYDTTKFGDYYKKECNYQEKMDIAVTLLREKLNSLI